MLSMIDYGSILKAINAEVRQGKKVIEQLSTDKQPDYPFLSYTVISPYLNPKTYIDGENITEEVEIVISYTWMSEESMEAMSLAQTSASHIKATGTRQRLRDKGVVVVDTMGFGNRDTFITIETERRVGFDVKIRITHGNAVPMDDITEINIQ